MSTDFCFRIRIGEIGVLVEGLLGSCNHASLGYLGVIGVWG